MDIASLIGFLGAIGMILGAMISGGGIAPFIDVPSILIVFGGISGFLYTSSTAPPLLVQSGLTKKEFAPSEIAQIGGGWTTIDHTGMPSEIDLLGKSFCLKRLILISMNSRRRSSKPLQ